MIAYNMMQCKHVPKRFWDIAIYVVLYILTRSPTKVVKGMTPYEEKKPRVENLKVFRWVSYAHISKENREKLDEKGEICIFVAYSNETKDYRLYVLESNELIISRDVIFIKVAK